ncbi:glycosyl hydrolase family 43 [Capsulimonas corticalis]|uniref:Glycosyl hydrolase family 43 n=1 Tax=Capsulimonas corticalis TaxID=2219043 RepID=A0A402CZ68_9BACT|nr:glycoside hydrolase family 43 protein [Capsulimonas corticalis]BDI29543.1 glycosyl hydrolase family 43 [Capsulimonas corticalis]
MHGIGGEFEPGEVWRDTDGAPIQAHGGGVLEYEGTYYWYGENKEGVTDPETGHLAVVGVSCYSSQDLIHWRNEGLALPAAPDDPAHDLHPSQVAERPKVIYNPRTRQFVLWLHVDSPDYTKARAGRAVSASPTGPFTYLGSVRPAGFESRDMTLFQDSDGAAYLFFSSDWNSVIRIARLTDDYLEVSDIHTEAFRSPQRNTGRESPAVFRSGDRCFFIGSGCTGWAPNAAEYAVAPSPLGPWEVKGSPCVGDGAETTFGSQNTFALPLAARPGAVILMLDRWNPRNLSDSRYVWLPLFVAGDTLTVEWRDRWDLSAFDGRP